MHDLVIKGATIVDGTGADAYTGDVAVDGGVISSVGSNAGAAKREIAAEKMAELTRDKSKATQMATQLLAGGLTPNKDYANIFAADANMGFSTLAKGKAAIDKDQFAAGWTSPTGAPLDKGTKDMLWKLGNKSKTGSLDAAEFQQALVKLDSVKKEVDDLKVKLGV